MKFPESNFHWPFLIFVVQIMLLFFCFAFLQKFKVPKLLKKLLRQVDDEKCTFFLITEINFHVSSSYFMTLLFTFSSSAEHLMKIVTQPLTELCAREKRKQLNKKPLGIYFLTKQSKVYKIDVVINGRKFFTRI